MNKIIWTCWWQGREEAPPIVKACLEGWERQNPGWELRCLDARTVRRFAPIDDYVDLDRQRITPASLADILRVSLLHEFGGVWVDATCFCNRPLDSWLPDVEGEGFFAFEAPAAGRSIGSWFLVSEPGHTIVANWLAAVVAYWKGREAADDYFWFHLLFDEICDASPAVAASWNRASRWSALPPQEIQDEGRMYRPVDEVIHEVNWTTPVFKLTYRLTKPLVKGCLLEHMLGPGILDETAATALPSEEAMLAPRNFASLKVTSPNLGDHIQIIAGQRLLSTLGVKIDRYIDRDNEIALPPGLGSADERLPILLNGWFKFNGAQWPPHPQLLPLILGFHIRLVRCPELASAASIEFFRRHQPVGCRDSYTLGLMQDWGVEAFVSRCLSLGFPRRVPDEAQKETFVVSRDERICTALPQSLGPFRFISHYSESRDFDTNMDDAARLLELYRSKAGLIVTTLLHCALPAIAMGIPVIVFYPMNTGEVHVSDMERFSALTDLIPVYDLEEQLHRGWSDVNWHPAPVDVSAVKLELLDRFFALLESTGLPPSPPLGPIAPREILSGVVRNKVSN